MDFDRINRDALACLESLLCEWLPSGRKDGYEFVALNPTRSDRKIGSFRINTQSGVWKDFATNDSGKDPVSLLAYIRNCKMGEAARELSHRLGLPVEERRAPLMEGGRPPSDSGEWVPQPHAPKNFARPVFTTKTYGRATQQWEYKTAQGLTIGFVARFDKPDGGKDVIPFSWCRHKQTGESKWRMKGFTKPRPLYGLDRLAARPDASVMIVEGEKAADAAEAILPDFVCVTWPGGSGNTRHCDFSPLQGRRVFIWPDRDRHEYGEKDFPEGRPELIGTEKPWHEQPGYIAAHEIAERIADANILTPPDGKADGWDAFDAKAEGWDPIAHWFSAAEVFPEEEPPAVLDNQDFPEEELFARDRIGDMPFRLLGSDRGVFYYLPDIGGQIIELTPGSHTKNNLFQLAPLQSWESEFPTKLGVDWDAASNGLIQRQLQLPKFSPRRVRGRGCWIDGDDIIFHAGDRLIVNGKPKLISRYNSGSKWIYSEGYEIPVDSGEVASNTEAAKLRDLCKLISWERPLYGQLLAGWLAIAPICGVLSWRPHLWLTGPAGTGKSWLFKNIINPMVGKTGISVQSSTTEAGIRQELGSDALPVIFDEAESEDKRSTGRIDMILELARQASSETGASILKGSAGGQATSFLIRSCFLFSSIGVAATKKSDTSRTTVLTLRKRSGTDQTEHFERLKAALLDSIGQEGYSDRVRARCLSLARAIRDNAMTFSRVAVEFTGDQRSADQVGALLAGAFALGSARVIGGAEARDWMAKQDWTGFQSEEVDSDERACVNHLLSAQFRVDGNSFNFTTSIGEAIEDIVRGHGGLSDANKMAEATLSRHGVRVDLVSRRVIVANKHQALARVFEATQWPAKWCQQLERVEGAEKLATTAFAGGVKSRATAMPLSAIGLS